MIENRKNVVLKNKEHNMKINIFLFLFSYGRERKRIL